MVGLDAAGKTTILYKLKVRSRYNVYSHARHSALWLVGVEARLLRAIFRAIIFAGLGWFLCVLCRAKRSRGSCSEGCVEADV